MSTIGKDGLCAASVAELKATAIRGTTIRASRLVMIVRLTWFSTTPVAVTVPPTVHRPHSTLSHAAEIGKTAAYATPSRPRVVAQPPTLPVHPSTQPDSQYPKRRSVRFPKDCEPTTALPPPGVSLRNRSRFGFDCRCGARAVARDPDQHYRSARTPPVSTKVVRIAPRWETPCHSAHPAQLRRSPARPEHEVMTYSVGESPRLP